MVRTEPSTPAQQPQSIYRAVMEWAQHTSTRDLRRLLAGTLAGAALVLALDLDFWPFAALCGSGSSIGLWGLAAHRTSQPPSRLLPWLQWALVGLGTLLALVGGLALFFGVLGPRWML